MLSKIFAEASRLKSKANSTEKANSKTEDNASGSSTHSGVFDGQPRPGPSQPPLKSEGGEEKRAEQKRAEQKPDSGYGGSTDVPRSEPSE